MSVIQWLKWFALGKIRARILAAPGVGAFCPYQSGGQGNCLRNSGIFWKFIENKLLLHQHESPKTSYSFLNKRYNVCRVHGNPLQQNIQHNMYHLSPKRQTHL